MDIAIRDGHAHKIVEECDTDVAVMVPFLFYPGATEELKLWWDKKHCIIFRDCHYI